MKKAIVIILAVCFAFALVSCSPAPANDQTQELEELQAALAELEEQLADETAEAEPETTVPETEIPEETVPETETEETVPEEETPAEPSEYVPGTVTDGMYINTYFGFLIAIPSDWTFMTAEEINGIADFAADRGAWIDTQLLEFQATDSGSNSINFTSEPVSAGFGTDSENLKAVLEASYADESFTSAYESLGAQNLETSVSVEQFAGEERVIGTITCDLVLEEGSAKLYQKQMVFSAEGRSGIVTVSCSDTDITDELMSMITLF